MNVTVPVNNRVFHDFERRYYKLRPGVIVRPGARESSQDVVQKHG